jgi:hypothetical protein
MNSSALWTTALAANLCLIACATEPAASPEASAASLLADAAADGGEETPRAVRVSRRQGGLVDGAEVWLFPDTPNGLRPSSSWFAVGGAHAARGDRGGDVLDG